MFHQAIVLALQEDSATAAMPLWQKAIALGLPPQDQVFARFALGEGYYQIVINSGLSWQEMVDTNEFRQGMTEMEKALQLDRDSSGGYFLEALQLGRLRDLDLMYKLATDLKHEREGCEAALTFLIVKMKAVEYIPRPPLLLALLTLANMYREKEAYEDAVRCLRKVLDTQPLYPADEERNEQMRGAAQQTLNEIERQIRVPPSGGAAGAGKYCTRCGKPLSVGARFCTECGAPVGQ